MRDLILQLSKSSIYSTKPVYGRMLGTIYLNNNDVNAIMVANGMAWAYRYQGRLIVPEYGPLEQNARNEGKGLWSDPHAIEPRQWRKANN
ncbi:thermonuclease family protein [Klebsiella pneumoniae]|nr:thermonuclease family protein [Klebsiella pneumoniae]